MLNVKQKFSIQVRRNQEYFFDIHAGTYIGGEFHLLYYFNQIKLLIENKLIISALRILHYQISREKFEPEPGFEPQTSGFLARRSTS